MSADLRNAAIAKREPRARLCVIVASTLLYSPAITYADGLGGLAGLQDLYEFYWALGVGAVLGGLWLFETAVLFGAQRRVAKRHVLYAIVSLIVIADLVVLARMGANIGPLHPLSIAVLIAIVSATVMARNRQRGTA